MPKIISTLEEAEVLAIEVASRNTQKYNLTKAAEELNELALVCLQFANKKGKYQPDVQEVVDEVGDVYLRLPMIIETLGISQKDIETRILHKANKFKKYVEESEYREI